MVVVDTNILAYLLIEGDRTRQAQALYSRDPHWRSEGFLLVEFSNILATCQRSGALARSEVAGLLREAEARMRGLVNLPHAAALDAALRFGVSAYDARFLAVAERLDARLVTEDARLRASAPRLTCSLAQALAGD